MRKVVLLIFGLLLSSSILAQDIQVAQSVSLSISFPRKFRFIASYNLSLVSHIEIEPNVAITPLVDFKFSIYDNHLGSSVLKTYDNYFNINTTVSYGAFFSRHESQNEDYYLPVFTSYYANSFNNDYRFNAGFTTSHVFQLGIPRIANSFYQRTGAVLIAYDGFYFYYNNDGGPLLDWFGDGLDRFWTGGLTVGFHLERDSTVHQFELLYEKFTGDSPYAYQASGLLHVDNVLYDDAEIDQFSLNSSVFSGRYLNHDNGLGASLNLWNPRVDVQDFIHRKVTHDPFHHKIEKFYIDASFYKLYTF